MCSTTESKEPPLAFSNLEFHPLNEMTSILIVKDTSKFISDFVDGQHSPAHNPTASAESAGTANPLSNFAGITAPQNPQH